MIDLRGEWDLAADAELQLLMPTLITFGGDCAIDLTDVTFIDAAGLGCLIRLRNQLTAADSRVIVTGATGNVPRVFTLTALASLLEPA